MVKSSNQLGLFDHPEDPLIGMATSGLVEIIAAEPIRPGEEVSYNKEGFLVKSRHNVSGSGKRWLKPSPPIGMAVTGGGVGCRIHVILYDQYRLVQPLSIPDSSIAKMVGDLGTLIGMGVTVPESEVSSLLGMAPPSDPTLLP